VESILPCFLKDVLQLSLLLQLARDKADLPVVAPPVAECFKDMLLSLTPVLLLLLPGTKLLNTIQDTIAHI
jgi:hypothetical protein